MEFIALGPLENKDEEEAPTRPQQPLSDLALPPSTSQNPGVDVRINTLGAHGGEESCLCHHYDCEGPVLNFKVLRTGTLTLTAGLVG